MRFFLLLCFFGLVLAVPDWRSCTFCQKVIDDTYRHFRLKIANTTDEQFASYFKEKCPQYVIISPIMELVCEEMVTNHPLAVSSGLRNKRRPQEICMKCDDC